MMLDSKTDGLDAALPLLQSRVGLRTGHAATWVLTVSVRRRHDCLHLLARERIGPVAVEQICTRDAPTAVATVAHGLAPLAVGNILFGLCLCLCTRFLQGHGQFEIEVPSACTPPRGD